MAPDGNESIRMEAVRGGLCPGVDAKGLMKEEEEEIIETCHKRQDECKKEHCSTLRRKTTQRHVLWPRKTDGPGKITETSNAVETPGRRKVDLNPFGIRAITTDKKSSTNLSLYEQPFPESYDKHLINVFSIFPLRSNFYLP